MSPRRATWGPRRNGFDHNDWLDLVEVSGPFLSIPVLRRTWPVGLDALDRSVQARMRAEHADYFDVPAADRDRELWIRYVLGDLLGWGERLRFGADVPAQLAVEVPEHAETITPAFELTGPDGSVRLFGLICDGSPAGRVSESGWSATPADRLALLLRRHDVPLGLATDGRWWVLVRAPHGKATTQAAFDASLWREERDLARAFVSLLGRVRFFGVPDEETLPALLDKSQENQEEITEALGVQVRRAVELLIRAIGQAEEETRRHRPGILPLDAHEAYVGAVAVMMRLVFLLFAEDRHLLPNDDPLYQSYYSASRLVDRLEERASEPGGEAALEHTDAAWHQLLALFRAVHSGVSAGMLCLPAYDGSLFDPDTHPWLEGRFTADDETDSDVLRIDDRTVMHMLRAVQYVEVGIGKGRERRRLSFSSLDVEQIGYVYEGLLGFNAFRADDVVLGLTGRPGDEEEIAVTDLEDLVAAAVAGGDSNIDALAERLADRFKDSGIGSGKAVAKKLMPLAGAELPDARRRLLSATGNDAPLAERLLPFYRLLRHDLSGLPTVFRKGTLYVTESPLRRFTGTHYTPRFLAEQVAEGALEPLVYSPGPLQTADTKLWKPKSSAEILSLKVADIAVGSAAFLVASARYLGARLIEAWAREGDQRARQSLEDARETGETIDTETDPVIIEARRVIIEHCLYGTDINPMAIEMAKLSLWLVSMDPSKPFTFVDDKLACGDSLLGITSLEQLEWMHLDAKRGRAMHEDRPWAFTHGATELAVEVADLRERISRLGDSTANYARKRELLAEAARLGSRAGLLADLVTGAALAKTVRKQSDHDPNMIAADLARLATQAPNSTWARVTDQARDWLDIDHVPGGFDRTPLHWPLTFPEVFLERGGFDAIVGNPPFLDGGAISAATGQAYRGYLGSVVAEGRKAKRPDIVSFFFLRAFSLINSRGMLGLLATNSICQGDTREIGLDRIQERHGEILAAIKSERWPTRSAAVYYSVVWISASRPDGPIQRVLDGNPVSGITTTLELATGISGNPERLDCNKNIAYQGSILHGIGFALPTAMALGMIESESENRNVLSPFLGGEDINQDYRHRAPRYVVNFGEMTFSEASRFSEPLDWVQRNVRPERLKLDPKRYARIRDNWWWYWAPRTHLYAKLSDYGRCIAIAQTSKVVMPVFVATGQVYAQTLIVFASDDKGLLALLSSAQHYWWAISRGSTMKGDLRYTATDVFETFVQPKLGPEIRGLGDRLDKFRGDLMLARKAGLTKTYNLVHDPRCVDSDIAGLREIHRVINHAVAHAYGWDDLDLDHGFHETRQGIRYTVGPGARQEILDRLLELNHERYAAEVAAGLHKGSQKSLDPEGRLF